MQQEIYCSFCGKKQGAEMQIVANPTGEVYICKSCIEICGQMLARNRITKKLEDIPLLAPKQIKERLDEYIIGQEDAKKVLSVAVYNHYKRINYNNLGREEKESIELEKSNILMIGPTGSGKTLLAKTLAKILNVPFAMADATTLTEAGYVGDDVENVLLKLVQAANYDIAKAERGIIYIDEIDKIARKSENKSITRDVSGEGVQQALLKIIESTVAGIPPQGGRKHPQQELLYINTTNILFICGGAFVGLEKLIEKRANTKASLGFEANIQRKDMDITESLKKVQPDDLQAYGLIPEFVGRLPLVVGLHDLNEEALVRILTEPKNAITKQYKKMFLIDGIDLKFEPDAIAAAAKKAQDLKTGARGLRTILEKRLIDVMYDTPSDKSVKQVVVDKDVIEKDASPKLIKEAVKPQKMKANRTVKTNSNNKTAKQTA